MSVSKCSLIFPLAVTNVKISNPQPRAVRRLCKPLRKVNDYPPFFRVPHFTPDVRLMTFFLNSVFVVKVYVALRQSVVIS